MVRSRRQSTKSPAKPKADGNPMLDAALAYAARGWPIFPTRASKAPYLENGVLDATTDPAKIREWYSTWPHANIAVDVGAANMMVLDLDPGHDRAELERVLGGLPETHLRAKTPRGGEHLFYDIADDEVIPPSASKICKNVDVRSFHSYVLLAPSKTPDGGYTWAEEGEPVFRSDAMFEQARASREKSVDADNWVIEADLPQNIDLARKWLKTEARIATEHVDGDHTAYATAAMMKSYGLSQERAMEEMWEHWNPRCDPPWSADEYDHLQTKVDNAYRYNTSPPGNLTPAYREASMKALFQPVEVALPSGRKLKSGRYQLTDRDGIDHIQKPKMLVEGMFAEGGYGLLYGQPGTFKTFLALDIALSVASGGLLSKEALWNGKVVSSGPVLFAAGEGYSQIKSRITAWEQTHHSGARVDNFVLLHPVPATSEGQWDDLIASALELHPGGYKLAVLDTVGRSMQGLNENAAQDVGSFTKMVETFQRELACSDVPCAVLGLHHSGHEHAGRERGSSVFGADADTRIGLEREGKAYCVKLTMTKQKDAAEWEQPLLAKLAEVEISPGVTSLVAAKPSVAEVAQSAMRGDTELSRDMLAKDILAALQSIYGRTWSINNLATEVRKRNRSLSHSALRLDVLGSRRHKEGWARKHVALRPYFDEPSERWITPATPSQFPPAPPGFEPSQYDAPMEAEKAANVVAMPRRRRKATS